MLVVAMACGNLQTYKIGDGEVVVSELGDSIVQVGTIFKSISISETMIALCTDEGLAFAEMRSDLSLNFRPHMSILPDRMVRSGVYLKENLVMIADFDRPGYIVVDCKTRQTLYTIDETNEANKECLKIESVPFFDYNTLPYVLSLTATGLHLINVKVKKSFMLRAGKFKDFDFQLFGELNDPVARLIYAEVLPDGRHVVE